MSRRRDPEDARKAYRRIELELLRELEQVRAPMVEEIDRIRGSGGRSPTREHLCCTRPRNQMRISPLEARAIAEALRRVPQLRAKLPAVLARLERELPQLVDDSERQSFDCPLLEGRHCMVHRYAKPIGCLAWNDGEEYTNAAWRAFEERDRINDDFQGRNWRLRAIPLWLKRVLRRELAAHRKAAREGKTALEPSTPTEPPKSPKSPKSPPAAPAPAQSAGGGRAPQRRPHGSSPPRSQKRRSGPPKRRPGRSS